MPRRPQRPRPSPRTRAVPPANLLCRPTGSGWRAWGHGPRPSEPAAGTSGASWLSRRHGAPWARGCASCLTPGSGLGWGQETQVTQGREQRCAVSCLEKGVCLEEGPELTAVVRTVKDTRAEKRHPEAPQELPAFPYRVGAAPSPPAPRPSPGGRFLTVPLSRGPVCNPHPCTVPSPREAPQGTVPSALLTAWSQGPGSPTVCSRCLLFAEGMGEPDRECTGPPVVFQSRHRG